MMRVDALTGATTDDIRDFQEIDYGRAFRIDFALDG
jgi:hypothetical protein